MATKSVWAKLRTMAYEDRLRSEAVGLLEELSDVREWAEATTELADAIEDAISNVGEWQEAEGREDKADAREAALNALGGVIEQYDTVMALLPFTEIGEA